MDSNLRVPKLSVRHGIGFFIRVYSRPFVVPITHCLLGEER